MLLMDAFALPTSTSTTSSSLLCCHGCSSARGLTGPAPRRGSAWRRTRPRGSRPGRCGCPGSAPRAGRERAGSAARLRTSARRRVCPAGSGRTGRPRARPGRGRDRTAPRAGAPNGRGTGGRARPATPRLKICVAVLLEGGVERVDGRLHRDRLVDDRHVAGVALGGLDELLVQVAAPRAG